MEKHLLVLGGFKEIHKYLYKFGARVDLAVDKNYYEPNFIYNNVIIADESKSIVLIIDISGLKYL